MEIYATDALYVVNAEKENQTTLPSTANSTTDLPTVVKTTHPILEHAQSIKKKKKKISSIKHSRNISYPETPKIVEGYIKIPKPTSKYLQTTQNQIVKKRKNDQELISKLFQLEPQDGPKFIQEIKPILLKPSTNDWTYLEKTSQYSESNPSKQSPREEIKTISPHQNPNKNQPNSKNPSKESTLSSPNTQNRVKPLIETERNQTENKTVTEPLNKVYHIENANQKEPSNQKRSKSS